MNFVFWFTIFSFIFGGVVSEDGWMQLEYIPKSNSCLTATENEQYLDIDTCNETNEKQLWKWDKNGNLKNSETENCAIVPLGQKYLKLGRCNFAEEQLTCLPFTLKRKTENYLVWSTYLTSLNGREEGKWRRYRDPFANICNYIAQVWRTLDAGPSKKIETGLSFLFVGIAKVYTNMNYLFIDVIDGERKVVLPVDISPSWISVSVGPTGIWFVPEAKNFVVLWVSNTNAKDSIISPQEIDGPDSIKDIDVGPTGLVFIINGSQICSRIGINDSQPVGSDWNCTAGNAELLSCGIDGCFFVKGVNITYQPENKTQKMQQFFTPFKNHIQDIDAGQNYELWVVTHFHDVYRRSGTSARLPCGSNWELVPGIQLSTISIGIFGPVGILASGGNGQAVILNGVPTPERQQELDRLCNANCKSEKKPCLARFRSIPGETSQLRCHSGLSLSGDTQYPGPAASVFNATEFERTLFKRPLLGRSETQMWLDYLCNDPHVNPVQGLRPSAVNYFAEFHGHHLTCQNLLDEVASNIDEKLKGLTKLSCAQIPLGLSSGMFPSVGFSSLYSRNGQPRFQNDYPGWCSNRTDDHLDIDFFFAHEICAIKLEGNNRIDRWILRYSLDGSDWFEYKQKLKGKYEETQILPVYIKARYLRFGPVIESNKPINYCLKLEVYGSSQAFKADSCVYYKKQLQATNDGVYIIYPSQGTKRELVYCTGLRNKNYSDVHQVPITSPVLKLPLHLKRTYSIWQGNCFKCRHVSGNFSGINLSLDETANIGDFRGTCISDPETCLNGLSFELWLGFVDFNLPNSTTARNIILKSGSKASRGFQLWVTHTDIILKVYTTNHVSECQVPIAHFNHWVHIVGSWDRRTKIAQLFVDKVKQACVDIWARNTSQTDDWYKGELKLKPIAKIGNGFVVAQNLSIWMRRITDKERQELFEYPTPKVSIVWSNWSACIDCKQYRHLECGNDTCDVDISEFQPCYDIRKCGLRINWPLDNKASEPCSTCRHLVASSALVLPTNSTVNLGHFSGTCVADSQLCVNGLTIQLWVWFAEYDRQNIPESESTILQSGSESGFRLTVKGNNVTFTLLNGNTFPKCTSGVDFNRWNHVVIRWDEESNTINFHVDNITSHCTYFSDYSSGESGYFGNSDDGKLVLGPIANVGEGYVVAGNLSIWMQAINDEEFDHLLQQAIPDVPAKWNEWSRCLKPNCTQKRERKCQSTSCTVNIRERKVCSSCPAPASNCDEIPQEGSTSLSNGIYSIYLRPHFNETVKVFCEQTLLEGGWLVILNRKNGSLSFDRGWDDYKLGFGDLKAEHWLGNENLHQLTKEDSFKLMIYFSDNSNTIISETTCDFFRVASESEHYAWNFKLCEGPASHALSYSNGAMFLTSDSDNDLNAEASCAKQYGGGFWYKNCSKVRFTSRGKFVSYSTENGSWVNMYAVTMMIKPYKKRYVEMNVVIRLVDEKWSEELTSNATHSFFLLAGKIKHNMQEVYRSDDRYISATVKSFSQGSVIVDIIIAYRKITGRQVITLKRQLDHGYLNGIMAVSYNYSDFRIINSSVPNGWPLINELYNTSSTSFNVSWYYMKNMSYVQGFRIYLKSLESTQWKTLDFSKHVFQTEVTDLKEFTMYEVLVLAYSLKGDGLPSPIRNVTTDEWVPEIGPPNLTVYWNKTDFAVYVTWSPIPQPFINGYLTHYVITYSNSTHNVTKTSRTNSCVLTGLPIFNQYTIDVVGATRIGIGLNSSKITYRTRGLPLPAPKNLTVTNMTGPAINVSWTAIPDHPNFDKVVGYRMYYYYLNEWKNLTIPVNKTHVVIHVVKWNVHYDITVAGLTVYNQEGQPVSMSIFLKNITAPKWPPLNLSCRGVSPYSIVVGWYGFTVVDTGGSLKGYKLSYNVKGEPQKIMNITLDSYQPWYTLENLHPWTEYEIRVLVYNEEGFSPLAKIVCKTSIGAPDPEAKPQNLLAHSYVSPTFITLSWPHVFMNGTRRGYRVHYRKISDAGSEIKDSRIEAMTFSENATEAIIPGLDVYSKYCFQLFALNENFPSKPSNSVCAETCRCPPTFYTNWFIQDPYVITSSSGIFPPLVKRMIAGVCGPCKAYNDRVVVDFKMDGNGQTAQKNTSKIVQLVKTIDATQVSFPVVGPETGLAGRTGSFIPIINNPMSAFITRNPVVHTKAQYVIQETIVNTLPFLAFTLVLLLLGAIFIWAAEYKIKQDTFPKPFHKGIQQGFWWAFVSVTSVGYGDKVPTSKAGQLFSVIWILYGTVFIGIITASLSAALNITFVVVSTDVTLYNSHVAAIDHSLEVQLGLHKGARVNEGRNFSDVNSILKAVENDDVDGALIDKLTAARLDNLSDPSSNLILKNVSPKPSTYGIFLAGNAIKLRKKFQQFLQNNADFVTEQIQNYTQPLKEEVSSQNEKDAEQKEKTSQANILSGSSPIFLPLLLWLLAVLIFVFGVGLVWNFIYYKHVAKAAKKNQVCAANETQTGALPLQQFVKDFHPETYAKLRDMKSRHIAELKALRKLKTR